MRGDLIEPLLPTLLPLLITGLNDVSDDVRAAVADALLPMADNVVTQRPAQVDHIISLLWESLVDMDELSASTASVLKLLAGFLSTSALGWSCATL